MIKEWYDKAWAEGMRLSRNLEDYNRYFKMLKMTDGDNLLDIGCGDGKLVKIASESMIQNCSTGIDISEVAIKKAEKDAMLGVFYATKIEDFVSNCKYVIITAIGSLEHCPDIASTLKKMYDLGYIHSRYLIVVPNSNFIYWKIKGKPGTHQKEIGETLYTLDQWSQIFKTAGFKIDKVTYDLGRGKLMKLAMPFIPLKYTYQFVFSLSK